MKGLLTIIAIGLVIGVCVMMSGCGRRQETASTPVQNAMPRPVSCSAEINYDKLRTDMRNNIKRQDENFVTETVTTEQILVENIEVEHTWEEATTYWDDIEG